MKTSLGRGDHSELLVFLYEDEREHPGYLTAFPEAGRLAAAEAFQQAEEYGIRYRMPGPVTLQKHVRGQGAGKA